jgi:hypothetical protein
MSLSSPMIRRMFARFRNMTSPQSQVIGICIARWPTMPGGFWVWVAKEPQLKTIFKKSAGRMKQRAQDFGSGLTPA